MVFDAVAQHNGSGVERVRWKGTETQENESTTVLWFVRDVSEQPFA